MSIPTTSSPVVPMDYASLRMWANTTIQSGGGDLNKWIEQAATYGVDEMDAMLQVINEGIGVDEPFMNVYQNADGQYMATFYNSNAQVTAQNPLVSNATTTSRGNIRQMLNRGINNATNKLNITRFPASGGLGQKAAYVVGSVGSAVGAVATGISLGKTIDSALYNANPDYWDSMGLGSINPETWKSITNGDDSIYAGLFNMILGIDSETGKGQMYMDENAFAYMAYALKQNGWFSSENYIVNPPSVDVINGIDDTTTRTNALRIANEIDTYVFTGLAICTTNNVPRTAYISGGEHNIWFVNSPIRLGNTSFALAVSDKPFTATYNNGTGGEDDTETAHSTTERVNGVPITYYYTSLLFSSSRRMYLSDNVDKYFRSSISSINAWVIAFLIYNGTIVTPSSVEGVSNQPNSQLPDVSGWNDLNDVLPSLQQQYPDIFGNPLIWDNYQPDGSNPQLRYVPVGFPTFNNALDTKPLAQTQTQTDTALYPDTTLADLLKSFTETATQTSPETSITPANPTDTGTGESPTPLPIIGSASALWSVYHPTQAQVNDFGAWLWGSPFLTNIGKLFSNPIEGVISLHKIFAPPVDSGTGTIVVGTLDSEVPSATVNQQYVTVDCGSVDLLEQFSNVFDYPPFTEIHIYLPFIGIVPLDTNDVMRSTIHVTYGVDVFTGACLAMVEVTRDGSTVNLYQYAGSASVEYPLSNVQNGQLLAGILSAGAGIASIALTGGVSAPAVGAIVGGAASAAKSNVGRSGGFSGNSGAMGIKVPYLIIKRPQTKVANTFPYLEGYPTNYSTRLGDCSGQVVVKYVHVEGINATDNELSQIETLLKNGVLI